MNKQLRELPLDALLPQLMRRWARSGLKIRAGASARAIADFEQKHAVHLPSEIRYFLSVVDGMEENEMDANMIRLWPLAEFKPVAGHPTKFAWDTTSFVLFADYSIWAHAYAVDCRGQGSSEVIIPSDDRAIHVSGTFLQFLTKHFEI